jgi:hypothetical protein
MRARVGVVGNIIKIALIAVIAVAMAESDGQTDDDPIDTGPEAITGTAVMPGPGSEQAPPKDPFAPYDIGPLEEAWQYHHLTPDEQAVVDRGMTADDSAVLDGYATAVRERSAQARTERAAIQLGVDHSSRSSESSRCCASVGT